MGEFYLLDLERTISTRRPFYWKRTKHGYTDSLRFAGLFSKKEAEHIVVADRDNRTVMIHKNVVVGILGKDMQSNESVT